MVILAKRPAPTVPFSHRGDLSEARREVQIYCQSLVDAGVADWRVNAGITELTMESGEIYVFGEQGITRLR
jgi:hypothetical protein